MLAGRFLVHILPVALVLAACALVRFAPPRLLPAIGAAVLLIQVGGMVWYARNHSVTTDPMRPVRGVSSRVRSELTWFDRTNRLFLRDAPMADALNVVVARMRKSGHPTTHIFSGQMGIVMFRLAARQFGRIDVTDRHGLADRRLATSRLAPSRER